ncbi:MAG: class I SAM-dependent methyltransferase [Aquisalinus sp.]|nr:class I SAM-dependent methyltransferase [Aquisalinus sp.]
MSDVLDNKTAPKGVGAPVKKMQLGEGCKVHQLSKAPFNAVENWRTTLRTSGQSARRTLEIEEGQTDYTYSLSEFILEKHHLTYGMPWVMGKIYFDMLVDRGVKPEDKVLDVGCGAGRVGIHLIEYLETGHYFGTDSHRPSLEAFAQYEVPMNNLTEKNPNLYEDYLFSLEKIGEQFDIILDFSTTLHLNDDLRRETYLKFAKVLAKGGRIISAPGSILLQQPDLKELGFKHCHRRRLEVDGLDAYFEEFRQGRSKHVSWNEIRYRASSGQPFHSDNN